MADIPSLSHPEAKVRVLFVCMGNICRSPMARAVFTRQIEQAGLGGLIKVDAAGTHAYHVGKPPDRRAQDAGARRGYSFGEQGARIIEPFDLEWFDYVLVMDRENLSHLKAIVTSKTAHKVRLFMSFASNSPYTEVPDPYYGGASGFERVLDLVEEAAQGLLDDIRTRYRL